MAKLIFELYCSTARTRTSNSTCCTIFFKRVKARVRVLGLHRHHSSRGRCQPWWLIRGRQNQYRQQINYQKVTWNATKRIEIESNVANHTFNAKSLHTIKSRRKFFSLLFSPEPVIDFRLKLWTKWHIPWLFQVKIHRTKIPRLSSYVA